MFILTIIYIQIYNLRILFSTKKIMPAIAVTLIVKRSFINNKIITLIKIVVFK